MEIKIAVTTIPFIFAPTQTITIGAKAVLEVHLILLKMDLIL